MKRFLLATSAFALVSLSFAACGGGTPNNSPTMSMETWSGVWQDMEDSPPTDVVVNVTAGQPKVISVGHVNGQTHSVTSTSWDGSHLTWTYRNTSTNSDVTYDNCALKSQTRMTCSWHNTQGGSGTVTLSRK